MSASLSLKILDMMGEQAANIALEPLPYKGMCFCIHTSCTRYVIPLDTDRPCIVEQGCRSHYGRSSHGRTGFDLTKNNKSTAWACTKV